MRQFLVVGLVIMGIAWKQIHRSQGDLVTSGLYSRVRHPQYSALFLIIAGTLVQWPTIVTLLMSPILLIVYYRLARKEEQEVEKRFGDKYAAYKEEVPMFLPRFPALSLASRLTSRLERE